MILNPNCSIPVYFSADKIDDIINDYYCLLGYLHSFRKEGSAGGFLYRTAAYIDYFDREVLVENTAGDLSCIYFSKLHDFYDFYHTLRFLHSFVEEGKSSRIPLIASELWDLVEIMFEMISSKFELKEIPNAE
jgi:hypothetical protein